MEFSDIEKLKVTGTSIYRGIIDFGMSRPMLYCVKGSEKKLWFDVYKERHNLRGCCVYRKMSLFSL